MKKLTLAMVVAVLLLMSFSGCVKEKKVESFEIHEWGVFLKGYDCNTTSILTESPPLPTTGVKKPVIYFHSLKNVTSVRVEVHSIRNATTIPNATIADNKIIWNVTVENDSIKVGNEETCYDHLFYEGEIDFPTHVTILVTDNNSSISYYIKNNESYTISDAIFVYGKGRDWIECVYFGDLQPGEDKIVNDSDPDNILNVSEAKKVIYDALISRGLTDDEAKALLDYWGDWWFNFLEWGFYSPSNLTYTRLIYIIPQTVYDQLLPIAVTPEPSSIIRVGVVTVTNALPSSLE